jgi:hypothetical protein
MREVIGSKKTEEMTLLRVPCSYTREGSTLIPRQGGALSYCVLKRRQSLLIVFIEKTIVL